MSTLSKINLLKSITLPGIDRIEPKGLFVIIGPNSSGKTQLLKDIQSKILGESRKLVVCEDIEINRPQNHDEFINILCEGGYIEKKINLQNNHPQIRFNEPHFGDSSQSDLIIPEQQSRGYFHNVKTGTEGEKKDEFLQCYGRLFLSSLFLDRRLVMTNTVQSLDYEADQPPMNEMQTLHLNREAKQRLDEEAKNVFGKSICLDHTRLIKLSFRVSENAQSPTPEERLEAEYMRKLRLIEDEGDGLRSYIGTCMTLLLGQRPICLIDEPELCLHPPQAYALGRFIGKYGISKDRATFVATHNSHVLRGILDETTELEIIRLLRVQQTFIGKKISLNDVQKCIENPNSRVETILDGLFAQAVAIVEAEGDRSVYSEVFEKLSQVKRSSEQNLQNVHFVSVGGMGGIANTYHLYKSLNIPVCIITDFDLLRESNTFHKILSELVNDEHQSKLKAEHENITKKIEELAPLCTAEKLLENIKSLSETIPQTLSREDRDKIRKELKRLASNLSPSARFKNGIDGFKENDNLHTNIMNLFNKCREIGLFLVPCGELENWLSGLIDNAPSKQKKAEWAIATANYIRGNDVKKNEDIWKFIGEIIGFLENEITKCSAGAGRGDQM